ncbi:MAG: ABC transporter substrate-binding protein [Betaproteobacteria bacterium]|nr:ABC transporter substrate-binding protein [Betaproteobacteria bacterium]
MKRIIFLLLSASLVAAGSSALAQSPIKLGFISAISGPLSAVGAEQKRGFDVAMEHLGGKLGGFPIEVIIGDSKTNPGATVQELSKLIEKDRVDLLTGLTASNELVAAIKPITDAKLFFIGMNGGPAQLAGEQCSPYYFNASFQNAQLTTGIGQYMSQKGVKKLYLTGMDYEAGHEHTNAARTGYKGEVVSHVFTPLAQVDFAADIAKIRASGADGVFAFYPGGPGIAFVRQWAQAGMTGKIPLYSNIALSEPTVFQAQGKTALGIIQSAVYFADLDNAPNKKFVAEFRKKFNRDPASYAGMSYDAMMLMDAAVREVKGNIKNQDAFRAALRRADFQSVRGPFKFNRNHQPIQNTYVTIVEPRADGSMYLKQIGIAAENAPDEFVGKCGMK